ncbi:glycosyltransferase [Azospirillum halopraeferens]|uniref:glycosyltransferase family protein n=1 Tax=Azospirillum halopraeferens TaxID=34010 RepID=UPI0012EB8386|nr:glycosyltransferase [Azospirillum halopraeferens]
MQRTASFDWFGVVRTGIALRVAALRTLGWNTRVVDPSALGGDAGFAGADLVLADNGIAAAPDAFAAACRNLAPGRLVMRINNPAYFAHSRLAMAVARRADPRALLGFIDMDGPDYAAGALGSPARTCAALPLLVPPRDPPVPWRQRTEAVTYVTGYPIFVPERDDWRIRMPQHAATADALAERMEACPDTPLWRHAAAVFRQRGGALVPWTGDGAVLMECVGRFVIARAKRRLLAFLARFPCRFVTPGWPAGLDRHPGATVDGPMPFPDLVEAAGRSRAVVSHAPNLMGGGLSERILNALARGSVGVAGRTRATAGLFREGTDLLTFTADTDTLGAHLERVFTGDPDLESVAETGRRSVERFAPVPMMSALLDAAFAAPEA